LRLWRSEDAVWNGWDDVETEACGGQEVRPGRCSEPRGRMRKGIDIAASNG
jgi:hypothetical protein